MTHSSRGSEHFTPFEVTEPFFGPAAETNCQGLWSGSMAFLLLLSFFFWFLIITQAFLIHFHCCSSALSDFEHYLL